MTFDFHPEAQAEFHDAAHWYEQRSYLAGDHFVTEMRATVQKLIEDPVRFPSVGGGAKVCSLKRFPFRIYFTYDTAAEHVCIQAVMHEKRRPDYWRSRLK